MKTESTLLPADWAIPPQLRNRLGTAAGRQRLMEEDGQLLLVLHAPPSADESGRRGRFFWRDLDGQWRAAPKAEGVATLERHLEEYRTAIEKLEQAEDAARDARSYFELLDHLTPLTRAAKNMYDTLQQARDAVREDRTLIVARDAAYDLTRRADLLYDDAKNGLDFAIAWQAEEQAETSYQMSVASHRLNLLVAFFFPIATVMTIVGANLRHGLEGWDESSGPVPLIAMLLAGLLLGFVLIAFVTSPAQRPKRDLQSNSSSSPTRRTK